jgi:hypothetical protein
MPDLANPGTDSSVRIERGACWAQFAFDIGHGIDLEAAEAALARSRPTREALSGRRRTPPSLQFRPAPLQIVEECLTIAVGSFASAPSVQSTFFDFGAVAVAFRIPLADVGLADLSALAAELYDCPALREAARERVRAFLAALGDAIAQPALSELVEDYVVFHAERWTVGSRPSDRAEASELVAASPALAAVLRVADEPLSDDEIEDALASRMSYGRHDLTIVDWNAAMVFDPLAEDTIAVLEFGNVELLEMRFLDDRLDAVLDREYRAISRRPRLRAHRDERRRLATLQIDSALLFEGINNAVKLVGDQYLARVYRLVARRFHLAEWDQSVSRKIEIVQRLYEKLSDEQATRRMELLEWIIILLIAISIVLPFVPGIGYGGH